MQAFGRSSAAESLSPRVRDEWVSHRRLTTILPESLRKRTRKKPTTAAASYEAGRTCMKSRPSRVMPLMAERRSRVSGTCSTGVCPHGAQVRTAIENRVKPGFVYPDDGGLLLFGFFLMAGQRCSYHALIATSSRLCGPLNGLLPTPATLPEQSPNMITMITNSKGLLNHHRHTARCPDVSAKAIGLGSSG